MRTRGWMVGLTSVLVAAGLASSARADEPAPLPAEESTGWFDSNAWNGGVEFGLNGSEGNSSTLTGRAGINGQRETDRFLTKAGLSYKITRTDSETTESKARLDVRNDWKLEKGSRWSVFGQGSLEYDEFQDWDMRLALFGGVGYRAIDEAKTKLNLRAGVGASREIGGSENKWTPEALLGADLEHQLTERQKLAAAVDVYPALDEFGEFRVIAKAGWEILVDPEVKMSLKLGVEDRYDSTPGPGAKRNDFDYFALLVWSF